jgi:two-component system, NtrC family, response regulator
MENILIVDDEKHYPMIIGEILQEEGYRTFTAASGMEALDILNTRLIDLVLTDVKMPGMTGIDLLEKIKELKPDMPVIIMTAFGSVEKAVEAMHKGAYTFILKPFENEALIAHITKAISVYKIVEENNILRDAMRTRYQFDNIIGKSKPMQELYEIIQKVAPTNASVLIEGESGTGKELVAKSIHYNSPRKDKTLVAVNCAAFAESLLESELFGHEKGAFTGAANMKKGRFELADKGTLFLDEIGELPMTLQVKLLRVLQERTVERVGGTLTIPVDFRLIAATNKTLEEEVKKGKFREDLYYRLNVVKTTIPPLRDRPEDILLLINHFIEKYTSAAGSVSSVTGIDKETAQILCDYEWKGNVRELENIIERAAILSSTNLICPRDLPPQLRQRTGTTLQLDGIPEGAGLSETLAAVEKRMIQRAMKLSGNVQTKAAQLLGIGKSGLNQKLKKFNLDKEFNQGNHLN